MILDLQQITNQSLHEDNVVGYFGDKKDLFSGFKWTLKEDTVNLLP